MRTSLFCELVQTTAFRRLQHISFLGSIDHIKASSSGEPIPASSSRYQHSLDVARLAVLYADITGLPESQRKLIYAAALLHDVGHAPLSHSMEPFFQEVFEIDHHRVTAEIITGRLPLGKEVREALRRHKVDPDEIVDLLEGDNEAFDGFFSSPINFDTIDGVLRCLRDLPSRAPSLHPTQVVCAATFREKPSDQAIVDAFWLHKQEAYSQVVQAPEGLLGDHICNRVAHKHAGRLSRQDFLLTDKDLFQKLPELREALRAAPLEKALKSLADILYERRSFFIDEERSFFKRQDVQRYRQSRHPTPVRPG